MAGSDDLPRKPRRIAPTLADSEQREGPAPTPGSTFDDVVGSDTLAAGTTVDRYVVEALVGQGGLARVYRVRHARLGTVHALKVLDLPTPSIQARILREGRAQGALRHPHVVAVTDVIEVLGSPGLVMEYVDGCTLTQLTARGRLPLEQAVVLGQQILRGVAAAHRGGLIHRDIKPSNVLVEETDEGLVAKVADFGLVKLLVGDGGALDGDLPVHTRSGLPMGTPGYMAPEQIRDASRVDARADVFALGAVLYVLLTGERAFEGDDPMALFDAVLAGRCRPPRSLVPGLPEALEAVVVTAMDPDPEHRYPDAPALLTAWNAAAGLPGTISVEAGTLPHGPARSRGPLPLVAGVAVAVVGVVAGFGILGPSDPAPPLQPALHQLTFEPGLQYQPTLSPDGSQLVYTDGDDLWLRRTDSERAVLLTGDFEPAATSPALSRDGSALVFVAEGGLYVAGPLGENPRRLVERGHHPTFSPDGQSVAYTTQGLAPSGDITFTDSELWVVDVVSGERRRLLDHPTPVMPSYAPDGEHLVFVGWEGGWLDAALWVVSSEGGAPTRITPGSARSPVWDSSGRWIYYMANRGDANGIQRLPVDPSTGAPRGPEELVAHVPAERGWNVAIAPQASRLAVTVVREELQLHALDLDPDTLEPRGPLRQLTRGSLRVGCPQVSPDGTELAFVSDGVRQDLYVLPSGGGTPRSLSSGERYTSSPRWSPDGGRIAFNGRRDGRAGIWTQAADGGGLKRISGDAIEDPAIPLWSPDGTRLAFTGDGPQPFVVELNGDWDAQVEAQRGGDGVGWFAVSWSPDGARLALTDAKGGLALMDADTLELERLDILMGFPVWAQDSTRLVVGTLDRVDVLDTSTGEVEFLVDLRPSRLPLSPPLSLAPDDSRLYLSLDTSDSDIWLVDLE